MYWPLQRQGVQIPGQTACSALTLSRLQRPALSGDATERDQAANEGAFARWPSRTSIILVQYACLPHTALKEYLELSGISARGGPWQLARCDPCQLAELQLKLALLRMSWADQNLGIFDDNPLDPKIRLHALQRRAGWGGGTCSHGKVQGAVDKGRPGKIARLEVLAHLRRRAPDALACAPEGVGYKIMIRSPLQARISACPSFEGTGFYARNIRILTLNPSSKP